MISGRDLATRAFSSLRVRNYRLYFFGQIISLSGTWMQSVAQAWLLLELTGSGLTLGIATALQFGPILVAGPWGGVVADRVDKRRLLVGTQSASATLALILGLLVLTGAVHVWMVYLLAFGLGLVTLVDMPTRQSFVIEMVGRDQVANAVSLNSVLVNAARVVGPAVAAVLIATVGTGLCFMVNAGSYLAVIAGLLMMRSADLQRGERAERRPGQLREGLRYVRSTPELWGPLLLMLVVGMLACNFSVVLPLLVRFTFHRGAAGYGALYSLMGVGAVGGGLVIAARGRVSQRLLAGAAVAFGLVLWAVALMPSIGWELAVMVPTGAASTAFIATSNSLLQLNSEPAMRGRVMSLWAVVFLGTTPLGGPLSGWLAEAFGPRVALAVGATATLIAGAVAMATLRHLATRRAMVPVVPHAAAAADGAMSSAGDVGVPTTVSSA